MGKIQKVTGIKTEPFKHQAVGVQKAKLRKSFAYLCEQGTGKTWMVLAEAVALYMKGEINTIIVLAPKGVDLNWIHKEIPTHVDGELVDYVCALWRPANTKKQNAELMAAHKHEGLRVIAMNWESINTPRGFFCAEKFATSAKGLLIVCDESQRIKNPSAGRTKALFKLRPYADYRRIATGTPSLNSPFDIFSQFSFLGSNILGHRSIFTFKNEYAHIARSGDPLFEAVIRNMAKKVVGKYLKQAKYQHPREKGESEEAYDERIQERAMEIALDKCRKRGPQLVSKDRNGMPRYRNLEKLQGIIEQHSYRVLKRDCLDLPEKVYTQTYYELTAKQRKVYNELRENARLILEDDTIQPVTKLTALMKMSQVCSGYYIDTAEGEVFRIEGDNPKLDLLADRLEDYEGQVIVWARLREEIEDIKRCCKKIGASFVEYHGGVSNDDRGENIRKFQEGKAQIFIGQQRAGGTGTTLTAANKVIYYSNSFSLEDRLQSEDRAHRIGQANEVVYEDLIGVNTIDEKIIDVLRAKGDLAALVVGDKVLD